MKNKDTSKRVLGILERLREEEPVLPEEADAEEEPIYLSDAEMERRKRLQKKALVVPPSV